MNPNYLRILLLLVAFVNCAMCFKTRVLRHSQKRHLQLLGIGQQPHCLKGSHYKSQYSSTLQSDGYAHCEPNKMYCPYHYNTETGSCTKCNWGFKLNVDQQQGSYCSETWYMTIIVVVTVIVFLIAGTIIWWVCCCYCANKRQG